MYGHLLQRKIHDLLRIERGSWYPAFVGCIAFAASVSMTIPFAGPLVIAVLFKPKRWKQLVIASSVGSALGATTLLMIFHHGAWAAIMHWHPHISGGASWIALREWLEAYGTLSLFIIMALPVPDSPALLFFALHQGNPLPVLLATFAGKFIKYSVYAFLVKTFPERFHLSTLLHLSQQAGTDGPVGRVPGS